MPMLNGKFHFEEQDFIIPYVGAASQGGVSCAAGVTTKR